MEGLLLKLPFIKKVFHAGSGNEAIKIFNKHSADIILMDIRMPDGNGAVSTRTIRSTNDEVKIIALTMMEDAHSVVNMFKSGVNGYLLKNTSFDELSEAIESVMSGERYYSKDISHIIMNRVFDFPKDRNKSMKADLTDREIEIIGLICRGFTNKDVGVMLKIAPKTVETHRSNIYSKLGISNMADLAFYALEEGLVKRMV